MSFTEFLEGAVIGLSVGVTGNIIIRWLCQRSRQ